MQTTEQLKETSPRESQIGPLAGVFTFMAAGSGVGLYALSQELTPTLDAMGINALWLDVGLFVAGVMTVLAAVMSKGPAPKREAVPAEG